MCQKYERKLEKFYQVSGYIAEFWNTISNLPFIVIGLLRLSQTSSNEVEILYILYVFAGIASAIHHATPWKWTILIDWIPISLSGLLILYHYQMFSYFTSVTLFKLSLAFFVLITDHVYTKIPVPWGHVCWHLLASLAIDSAYQDVKIGVKMSSSRRD